MGTETVPLLPGACAPCHALELPVCWLTSMYFLGVPFRPGHGSAALSPAPPGPYHFQHSPGCRGLLWSTAHSRDLSQVSCHQPAQPAQQFPEVTPARGSSFQSDSSSCPSKAFDSLNPWHAPEKAPVILGKALNMHKNRHAHPGPRLPAALLLYFSPISLEWDRLS